MNKINKTIWNQSLGQWVVCSEITKNHTPGNSSGRKHLQKSIIAAVLLSAPFAASYATNCTTSPSGLVTTCNGDGTAKNQLIVEASGSATSTTPKKLIVNNQKLVLNNSDIDANPWRSAISLGGNNGSLPQTAQNYGDLTLEVNNSIVNIANTTTKAFSALYLRTDSVDAVATLKSDATINITDSAGSGRSEGILIETFGAKGTAHVVLNENSNISLASNTKNGAALKLHGYAGGSVNTAVGSTIETSGAGIHGLSLTVGVTSTPIDSRLIVNNKGSISTKGDGAHAIYALASHHADIQISNSGNITTTTTEGTTNGRAHGIYIYAKNGNGTVSNEGGSVITTGRDNSAIRVTHENSSTSGNVAVNINNGSYIETNGVQSDAVHATIGDETGGTPSTVSHNGNVTVIVSNSTIKTTGAGSAEGIYGAITRTGVSLGDVNIHVSSSEIITEGAGANRGIYARTQGLGNIQVTLADNTKITTTGDGAHAVYALKAGDADSTKSKLGIESTLSNIKTLGNNAHGLYINTAGDRTESAKIIANSGKISLNGLGSKGIFIDSRSATNTAVDTEITAINFADITHNTNSAGSAGIEVITVNNQAKTNIQNHGKIDGGYYGIRIWDNNLNLANAGSTTTLSPTSAINATEAISIHLSGENRVNLLHGSKIHGADTALVFNSSATETATNSIYNSGKVTSDRDLILNDTTSTSSTLTFANEANGDMTGIIQVANAQTALTNRGTWTIQDRTNATTALVDFGAHADNSITNMGTINFKNDRTTFAGVNNFSMDGGVLDLSSHGTPGAEVHFSSGSNFIANGGVIKLRTALGDNSSATDKLYLSNVALGTSGSPTKITVVNTGGLGGETQDNGIEIINVTGTSDSGAFTLSAPVSAGLYEYVLEEGTDNNWYLKNAPDHADKNWNWDLFNGLRYINPNIGSYMGTQAAAAQMFSFNILDRTDSTRASDQALWVRVNHNKAESDLLNGLQSAEINTTFFQIGADLFQANGFVAGAYLGYGDSKIENRSNQTGSTADGKVKGYHVGAYGSWLPADSGLYVDTWGYYAWYNNTMTGASQLYDAKYDSKGYSLSTEVGYAFNLHTNENGRSWVVEPNAQITYSNISTDNVQDSYLTYYHNAKSSGLQTRIGARIYAQQAPNQIGVTPFIEGNWLHNNAENSVTVNNRSFDSKFGRDVGEIKIGVQGKLNESLNVWGNLGFQKGNQDFKRSQIQIGLGFQW